MNTLLETKIAPENTPLEKEIRDLETIIFRCENVSFREGRFLKNQPLTALKHLSLGSRTRLRPPICPTPHGGKKLPARSGWWMTFSLASNLGLKAVESTFMESTYGWTSVETAEPEKG